MDTSNLELKLAQLEADRAEVKKQCRVAHKAGNTFLSECLRNEAQAFAEHISEVETLISRAITAKRGTI